MGRNGIYYRAALGKKRGRSSPKRFSNVTQNPSVPQSVGNDDLLFQEIESDDVTQIVDSSSQDVVEEISSKRKLIPFWPFSILLAFIPTVGPVLTLVCGCLLYLLVDKSRKTTVLFYDIDEQAEQEIQQFYDAFEQLRACNGIWHVQSQAAVHDRKYQAGASAVVKRNKIAIQYKAPPYVSTNVKIPVIPVGNQKIYFFPDKILIFEKKKVGGLSYTSLSIDRKDQRFIESGTVPRDGTVVDHTWRVVNKSGGPDKRIKNNPQLPILLYSEISFKSSFGLNELIQLSRQGAGVDLIAQLKVYQSRIASQDE